MTPRRRSRRTRRPEARRRLRQRGAGQVVVGCRSCAGILARPRHRATGTVAADAGARRTVANVTAGATSPRGPASPLRLTGPRRTMPACRTPAHPRSSSASSPPPSAARAAAATTRRRRWSCRRTSHLAAAAAPAPVAGAPPAAAAAGRAAAALDRTPTASRRRAPSRCTATSIEAGQFARAGELCAHRRLWSRRALARAHALPLPLGARLRGAGRAHARAQGARARARRARPSAAGRPHHPVLHPGEGRQPPRGAG